VLLFPFYQSKRMITFILFGSDPENADGLWRKTDLSTGSLVFEPKRAGTESSGGEWSIN